MFDKITGKFKLIKYEIDILNDGTVRYFKIIDLIFITIPLRIKNKEEIENVKQKL